MVRKHWLARGGGLSPAVSWDSLIPACAHVTETAEYPLTLCTKQA